MAFGRSVLTWFICYFFREPLGLWYWPWFIRIWCFFVPLLLSPLIRLKNPHSTHITWLTKWKSTNTMKRSVTKCNSTNKGVNHTIKHTNALKWLLYTQIIHANLSFISSKVSKFPPLLIFIYHLTYRFGIFLLSSNFYCFINLWKVWSTTRSNSKIAPNLRGFCIKGKVTHIKSKHTKISRIEKQKEHKNA